LFNPLLIIVLTQKLALITIYLTFGHIWYIIKKKIGQKEVGKMRKRLSEISSFEAVLCLFVVMIHILSDSINSYPTDSFMAGFSFLSARILTFAVPAFIMSSGIKFAHIYSEGGFNYLTFLRRRITKIYIPYLIIATIYYLYFVFHRHYFDFNWIRMLNHLSLGTIAAPFYFIVIIMQLYLLAPFTLGFCKHITPLFGIILAAAITILSKYLMLDFKYADKVFLSFFAYWIVGCYLGLNFDKNLEKLRQIRLPIVFLSLILTVVYLILSYFEFVGAYQSFFIEFIKMLFTSVMSIGLLIFMPRYEHEGADILSPATYYIYLIHCLVIFETEHIMETSDITSVPQRFWITFFATYIISITLSVLYSRIKLLFTSDDSF
jgi:membrane-bound acyltransferase YfiQ involved in biofilm formation